MCHAIQLAEGSTLLHSGGQKYIQYTRGIEILVGENTTKFWKNSISLWERNMLL